MDIASGYLADRPLARHIGEVCWWAIPLLVAAWARATFFIAGKLGQPEELSTPASVKATLWQRLKPRSIPESLIWIAALFFSTIGSIPDLGLSFGNANEPGWNGYPYQLHKAYFAFTVYAFATIAVSLFAMWFAWENRTPTISKSRSDYGQTTLVASIFIFLAGSVLLLSAVQVWPEALVDFLLAIYAFWFVMNLANARRHDEGLYTVSLARRAIGGGTVVAIVFAGVAASGLGALRAGLLGALVAGCWPLVPTIDRALSGRRAPTRAELRRARAPVVAARAAAKQSPIAAVSEGDQATIAQTWMATAGVSAPLTLTEEEREELKGLLESGSWPNKVELLGARRRALAAAALVDLERLAELDRPIRDIVNLRGHSAASSQIDERVYLLLSSFIALQDNEEATVDWELRIQRQSADMLDLIRRSSRARRELGQTGRKPGSTMTDEPMPLRLLETECAEKLPGEKYARVRESYASEIDAMHMWRKNRGWGSHGRSGEWRESRSSKAQRNARIDQAGKVLLDDWIAILKRNAFSGEG